MSQQRFIVLLRFDSRRKKVCCFVGRYPNVPDLPFNRDLSRNWCRNPDGDQAPWCYTTDPTVRWEYCNLEKCPTKPSGTTRPQPQEPSTNTQTPAERGKSTFFKMWICQHFACLSVFLSVLSLFLVLCCCFRLQDWKWRNIPRSNFCYCAGCDLPGVERSDSSRTQQLHSRDSRQQRSGRQCKCVGVAI